MRGVAILNATTIGAVLSGSLFYPVMIIVAAVVIGIVAFVVDEIFTSKATASAVNAIKDMATLSITATMGMDAAQRAMEGKLGAPPNQQQKQ